MRVELRLHGELDYESDNSGQRTTTESVIEDFAQKDPTVRDSTTISRRSNSDFIPTTEEIVENLLTQRDAVTSRENHARFVS